MNTRKALLELYLLADWVNDKPSENKKIFIVNEDNYREFDQQSQAFEEQGLIKNEGFYYYDELDKNGFVVTY